MKYDYGALRERVMAYLAREPFAQVRKMARELGVTNQAIYRAAPIGAIYMRKVPKPSRTAELRRLAEEAGRFEEVAPGATVRPGR